MTSQMPQVTAADFSTIKHNNNNTPPMKDAERGENNNGEGISYIRIINILGPTEFYETNDYYSRLQAITITTLAAQMVTVSLLWTKIA